MKSTSWIILASIFLMAGNASGAGIKDESDPWGSALKEQAQFFKAEDVSEETVKLTRKWHEGAAKAGGN